MKVSSPANLPRWSQHVPMEVASLGTSAKFFPDLANALAPAQVGGLTPILQEILHRHQHLGLRLQVQLQGWEGDCQISEGEPGPGETQNPPQGLPQSQGGPYSLARQWPGRRGWEGRRGWGPAQALPKPRPSPT